ncbi:lymphotoxin-beta [Microcaecilia unicolor]|uniref:Lymphotoxin-beta n=1 Tax=Microcaecilia unicolor TaxID=1415580 RepID=A0A6P7XD81_9AMPH|nr:lymphotoxin-beta [Microcaecilia unicolor]
MDASRAEGGLCTSRLALIICAVLGTLALSVPSTTLLVMYFTRNGGQLSPGGQVSPKTLEREMEKLYREDKVAKPSTSWYQQNPDKPMAHLTAIVPQLESQTRTLEWEATPAFSPQTTSPMYIPKQGLYYVYSQVGFRNRSCHAGPPLTLFSKIFHCHDANQRKPVLLLEGSDTVCEWEQGGGKIWYTSISQGTLVLLEEGHQLYVNVSHPQLVDYQEGKTFFGFMMIS